MSPKSEANAPSGQRIVVVRLSALGDVLHALPAVHDLRRAQPHAHLSWIAQDPLVPLLEAIPWIDEVLPFDRHGGLGALLDFRRRAKRSAFDIALDLQGNWKSTMIAVASRARRRWSYAARELREPGCRWILHRRASPSPSPHAIDRARHAVASLWSLEEPSAPPDWRAILPLCEADVRAGTELRARAGLPEDGSVRVLMPTARPDPRAWPADHWIELARRLGRDEGIHVLWMCGPDEEELGALLSRRLSALDRVHAIPHQSGVRAALALLRSLADRGGLAIASDGGALHLASAAGLPVLGLAGPQDPERTGAHGPSGATVRAGVALACRPCRRRTCSLTEGPRCLDELSVEEVLHGLERLASRFR